MDKTKRGNYNEREKYECEYCKEKFRLIATLNNHIAKCRRKIQS